MKAPASACWSEIWATIRVYPRGSIAGLSPVLCQGILLDQGSLDNLLTELRDKDVAGTGPTSNEPAPGTFGDAQNPLALQIGAHDPDQIIVHT